MIRGHPGQGGHVPLVSIGIPTFNRAASLKRAVASVLAQDYSDLELIISDNGSIDETEGFCREIVQADRRIRYIRKPQNEGGRANFLTVLSAASGEYFMWLGDDDWLHGKFVSRCVSLLAADPAYALVSGKSVYFEDGRLPFEGETINLPYDSAEERVVEYYAQVVHNGIFYGVARRSLLLSIPLRDTLWVDGLIVAGLAFLGKIATLEDIYLYRNQGMSRSYAGMLKSLGYSGLVARYPMLVLGWVLFTDIMWRGPVYRRLRLHSRLRLAFASWYACYLGHAPEPSSIIPVLRAIAAAAMTRTWAVVRARLPGRAWLRQKILTSRVRQAFFRDSKRP